MIKIEKGIPIPSLRSNSVRIVLREQLTQMDDGDSFPIEAQKQASVRLAAREVGVKIVVRQEGKNVRVWKKLK